MHFASKPEEPGVVSPDAAEPAQPVVIPVQPGAQNAPPPPAQRVPRLVIWSQRIFLVVTVVFCIELGILLAILPWTTVWNQNNFLVAYPALKSIIQSNFVRGLATGLGLIDVWVGIWEAVHYRDPVK